MQAQPISLHEVCALVERHGVSPADAAARYYAGRTPAQLAEAKVECTRTLANAREGKNACLIANSTMRLAVIVAETERRQLAAGRGEAVA